MAESDKLNIDSVINRLLEGIEYLSENRTLLTDSNSYFFVVFYVVRGSRPGKNVQLTEAEIRGLCLKSREIFLSQPILLELEAPLKICGMPMQLQWRVFLFNHCT